MDRFLIRKSTDCEPESSSISTPSLKGATKRAVKKTNTDSIAKKRSRYINPDFLAQYGITDVDGVPVCVICYKQIAEESLKPNKLQRHLQTHPTVSILGVDARKRVFVKRNNELQKSRNCMTRALTKQQKIDIFTYKTAFLSARTQRPYTESEMIIKPSLLHFADIFKDESFGNKLVQTINDIPLSNDTMTRRVEKVASDLKEQILNDFRRSSWAAIALDESTDNTANAQLLLYGKYETGGMMKEELLALLTLTITTKGEDIYNIVNKFFTDHDLSWDKIVEANVDGAPAMMGRLNGFNGLLSRHHPHVSINHCIIHRQALASKDLSAKFGEIMKVCVTVINYIKAREVNCRMFRQLCVENDADHSVLLLYNTVRWLSRGKALERVFILREEIHEFLSEKGHQHADEFGDQQFLSELALLVDILHHVNSVNTELQGRGKLIFDLHSSLRAFMKKLDVLQEQIKRQDFSNFPMFVEFIAMAACEFDDFPNQITELVTYIGKLQCNFVERFPDMKAEYTHITSPFQVDATKFDGKVALELSELQEDNDAKIIFNANDTVTFWFTLDDEKYPKLIEEAQKTLVRFGTTYVCEAGFSHMLQTKTKYRSRITDAHLFDCLVCSLTTYEPRYEHIVSSSK